MGAVRNICVFCGAAEGNRPVYAKTARALGQAIAERGLCLVYGAGNVGLMGMLAESVLSSGGEVSGVIPEKLVDRELAARGPGGDGRQLQLAESNQRRGARAGHQPRSRRTDLGQHLQGTGNARQRRQR